MKKDNIIATEQQETRLFQDACQIIEQAQESAYRQVNETLIKRNWLLGMRINMDVLKTQRAEYGEQIVKTLATSLTLRYGEGFTKTNLYNYIGFYQKWPEIFHAVSGKSIDTVTEQGCRARRDETTDASASGQAGVWSDGYVCPYVR